MRKPNTMNFTTETPSHKHEVARIEASLPRICDYITNSGTELEMHNGRLVSRLNSIRSDSADDVESHGKNGT